MQGFRSWLGNLKYSVLNLGNPLFSTGAVSPWKLQAQYFYLDGTTLVTARSHNVSVAVVVVRPLSLQNESIICIYFRPVLRQAIFFSSHL
jgi:hypothetical protein